MFLSLFFLFPFVAPPDLAPGCPGPGRRASNDSDFFVHAFGQVKMSSLFQKQFRLERDPADHRPIFVPGDAYDVPLPGETLLTSTLATMLSTTGKCLPSTWHSPGPRAF